MIKKNWKTMLITSLVILLPIVAGLILWDRLPEQLPIHWNAAGEVDGWTGKAFAVFGLPLLMLGFQWLCVLVTGADPKKKNHSDKVLQLVLWLIPLLSVVLNAVTYMAALGTEVAMEMIMPILMGLLFTVIGNYLPKCKQNYTIGIKIAWTLDSEENWNRTHRFAGWLWTFCGLAMIATAFFGGIWVFLVLSLLMVGLPVGYSYMLHRKGI